MSLPEAVALVVATAAATGGLSRLVAPYLGPRCPGCRRRALVHDARHACSGYVLSRCAGCRARWVWCAGGLVSLEAFAAGARSPIPAASVVRDPRRARA